MLSAISSELRNHLRTSWPVIAIVFLFCAVEMVLNSSLGWLKLSSVPRAFVDLGLIAYLGLHIAMGFGFMRGKAKENYALLPFSRPRQSFFRIFRRFLYLIPIWFAFYAVGWDLDTPTILIFEILVFGSVMDAASDLFSATSMRVGASILLGAVALSWPGFLIAMNVHFVGLEGWSPQRTLSLMINYSLFRITTQQWMVYSIATALAAYGFSVWSYNFRKEILVR